MIQSILQKCERMSIKDGQCHAELISYKEVEDFMLLHNQESTYVYDHFKES